MLLTAFLIAAASAPVEKPGLVPASVSDVVTAAVNCFDAVAAKDIQMSRLSGAGWTEVLDGVGKPETPGGHLFRRPGLSAEIAVVGPVCSLVAPVGSFDDVQATLLKLDDTIHPDSAEEVKEGILLTKDHKSILFWVGNPTVRTPAAVRIDVRFLETK